MHVSGVPLAEKKLDDRITDNPDCDPEVKKNYAAYKEKTGLVFPNPWGI